MTDVQIRTAQVADLEDLGEVFRRSSLANDGDRAMLLANPEALEPNVVTSVHEARTRAAVVDDRIVGLGILFFAALILTITWSSTANPATAVTSKNAPTSRPAVESPSQDREGNQDNGGESLRRDS